MVQCALTSPRMVPWEELIRTSVIPLITINNNSINRILLEQISYECEKTRLTARSRHSIEEIGSTNHIARDHYSSNQSAAWDTAPSVRP
jgi:hypothetical protein